MIISSQREGLNMEFSRIIVALKQMGGMPCMRGLRIPVATVVGLVKGLSEDEILNAYPSLEREDIREALQYAAEADRRDP
jgi:uncharacterized protein (DUF433 family)